MSKKTSKGIDLTGREFIVSQNMEQVTSNGN